MKRIVIFSDTHGNIHPCLRVLPGLGEISMVIHLGDTVTDCEELRGFYPQIPFVSVKGNNDWFSPQPTITETEFEGVKLLCTHGHSVSRTELLTMAKESGCAFVLFGHTHRSLLTETDGITFFNPGSISRPRDGQASYGVIEIENGIAKGAIIPC
ncbi:MAG: metallophosphoesterase [Ruminococcaceae bacterium]|nr:metallophosphoesterase [Oscillospiraceae bacterium]